MLGHAAAFAAMAFMVLFLAALYQNDYSVLILIVREYVKHKRVRCAYMNAMQCRMARAALSLGVRDLAQLAEVAPATITRLERGEELLPRTVSAIRTAIESAGVQFIAPGEAADGMGVVLRSQE